jgi:hypothetical protein
MSIGEKKVIGQEIFTNEEMQKIVIGQEIFTNEEMQKIVYEYYDKFDPLQNEPRIRTNDFTRKKKVRRSSKIPRIRTIQLKISFKC